MHNKLKILYFRYFFGGREDVYAFRIPDGGYRPRRRPRFDLTNSLIVSHMRGQVMLGAYPLMWDGTTRWVAADFDGKNNNAFQEARILSDALRCFDIETLCNTSQSGNGVHVRVIVEAWFARNLIQAFIEKEGIRKIADGGAFDRMFPTQDELDARDDKSIGNQIAMPLNMRAAQERGGSMLLDNDFQPIPLGEETWDAIELYERVNRVSIGDAIGDIGRTELLWSGTDRARRTRENAGSHAQSTGGRRYKENERRGDRNTEDLRYMVAECEFMRYADAGSIGYFDWMALASNLAQFDGVGGRRFFHILSSRDGAKYSTVQAEKKYDNILRSFNAPVTCSTLAQDGWRCPIMGNDGQCNKFRDAAGRGPRAPAAIPFFVEKEAVA